MKSAEFAVRIDQRIRCAGAGRFDNCAEARIAATLTVPSYYEIDISRAVDVEK